LEINVSGNATLGRMVSIAAGFHITSTLTRCWLTWVLSTGVPLGSVYARVADRLNRCQD
jgi:hypothetical protein